VQGPGKALFGPDETSNSGKAGDMHHAPGNGNGYEGIKKSRTGTPYPFPSQKFGNQSRTYPGQHKNKQSQYNDKIP